MAQLVKCPLFDREIEILIPSQVTPNTLKMVLVALSLGTRHEESRARSQNWSAQCQHNVTGWNIVSCLGLDVLVRQHPKSEL